MLWTSIIQCTHTSVVPVRVTRPKFRLLEHGYTRKQVVAFEIISGLIVKFISQRIIWWLSVF